MKKKKKKKSINNGMSVSVWCANGLCKGQVFRVAEGTQHLRISIPTNPFYKLALYAITDKITNNGEYAAIFLRGVPR